MDRQAKGLMMIIKALISITVAVIIFFFGKKLLDDISSSSIKILAPANPDEAKSRKALKKKEVLAISTAIAAFCCVGCMCILNSTDDVINIVKLLVSMTLLSCGAFMDIKEHRIPNIFPGIMAAVNILLLVVGFLTRQNGIMSYIASAVISTVCIVAFMSIASFLTRGGIGLGDIKLLGAMSLIGDVYLMCGTLFFSALLSAILGIALILIKRKTIKEGFPFAPFVLAGFLICLYLKIY